MKNKVLLMILDGWGIGPPDRSNAIYTQGQPHVDALLQTYPHAQLLACGQDVGLPDGQMGNSEVGHLNIGAGRVVYQDLVKINRACADNSIMQHPEIVDAYTHAAQNGRSLHLMGLVSDGGVHSSLDHLFKLCDIAKHYKLSNVFVHCFMDGRDTDPHSGKGFISKLLHHIQGSNINIASIVGRYYAMDRDKRWERIGEAYQMLVNGQGRRSTDLEAAMQQSYDEGVTDEFVKPIVNTAVDGRIKEGDVVIFFNFRNDRAKQLTTVLTQADMPEHGMKTIANLRYYCMTPYDSTFKNVHVIFDKETVDNTLAEHLSSLKINQLHIAETEKYAHVTFFLNGGRERPFEGEDRILIDSPKVPTYDLKPEMSAYQVKDALIEALKSNKYGFAVVNFANGDMVGHTGVYDAIKQAVFAVDKCVGEVVQVAKAQGYEVILIADHGNADNAVNPDGTPNTAHSLNPVPIIVVSERVKSVKNGRLADVAPTVLTLMGIDIPKEMDGQVLAQF